MIRLSTFVVCLLLFLFISEIVTVAFNPATATESVEDSWHTKKPSKQEYVAKVVAMDGKIYAISNIIELYDPTSDKWTTLKPMHISIEVFDVVACKNKIYCIGVSGGAPIDAVGVNEVYDIRTGRWSTKSPPPIAEYNLQALTISAYNLQAHVIDSKIFIIFNEVVRLPEPNMEGVTGSISYLFSCSRTRMFMYDPSVDSWTEINSSLLPPHKGYFHSFIMDDKIMFTSTFYLESIPTIKTRTVDKIFVYDPQIDTWTETNLIPPANVSSIKTVVATTGIYAPQKIYFIQPPKYNPNYDTVDTIPSTIFAYDPVNGTHTYQKMPMPLYGYAVVVVDDILYVVGNRRENTGQIIKMVGYRYEYFPVNLQYVPVGYHGILPSTEFSFKPIILAVSVIIISIASVALIYSNFYKKRRFNMSENETEKDSEISIE